MKQAVYVCSLESQQIYVWQLNDAGVLTLLQIVDAPGQVQPIAIHPNKSHLYVGSRPLFNIISYRIQEDGTLRQAGISLLHGSSSYISTDFLGRYLFSASYSGNCISVSKIDHNGIVTPPLYHVDGLITPHSVNIHPGNQYLLVPCLKEDRIYLFNLGLDGQLTMLSQKAVNTAIGAGPRHMAFYPNGKYAYCLNELNGTVDVLTILANGKKYRITQTLDIMPIGSSSACWAADIHITPNSRFLYVSERTTSLLTIFSISIDGSALSAIGHHSSEVQPRSFNIDCTGRFLISACQKSNDIIVHEIEQKSGKLNKLARYPVGKNPVWVSIL